jgi:hypothetical protein
MDLAPPLVKLLGDLARLTANTPRPFVTVFFGNPYVPAGVPTLPAVLLTYDFYDLANCRPSVRSPGCADCRPAAGVDSRNRECRVWSGKIERSSVQVVTQLARIVFVIIACGGPANAQTPSAPVENPAAAPIPIVSQTQQREIKSPWLLAPLFSSNPKLGAAGGAIAGYMRYFDAESRLSVFGVMYQYTSTHSQIAGVFARTSFGADHHRIVGIGAFGNVKNDYDDYLGTGQPLKTDSALAAGAARYLYVSGATGWPARKRMP